MNFDGSSFCTVFCITTYYKDKLITEIQKLLTMKSKIMHFYFHYAFQLTVTFFHQPLDYEHKRRFVIAIEVINSYVDTRFLSFNEFRDRTMLKILVIDVDEPPVFSAPYYEWKLPENAIVGTVVGTVYARDADAANNPIR